MEAKIRNSDYLKQCFTTNVFQKFTEAVGGDANHFADVLFNKFVVDDFAYGDDMYYWGVLGYFEKTVVPHKIEVFKAGFELLDIPAIFDLLKISERKAFKKNLWLHDMSKFSAPEAFGYAMHDFKNPNSKSKDAFELSWHHHKMNNPHHPEYWLNPNRSGVLEPIEMPAIYVLEMVADWIGAGKCYGSTIEVWLPENLHKFRFHPKTICLLMDVLQAIGISTYSTDINNDMGEMRLFVCENGTKMNSQNK
jgi:hypothetical protein